MARTVKVADGQTWNARSVARLIAEVLPGVRAYDGRDVRGLARGDNGPAVIARYAEAPGDGSNRSHVYSLADVRLLLAAVVQRHAKRTGTTLVVPAPFAATATAKRTTKRTTKPAATVSAPEATETGDAPSM